MDTKKKKSDMIARRNIIKVARKYPCYESFWLALYLYGFKPDKFLRRP